VTFAVVWEPTAVDLATRFLSDDADGLRSVFDAVDALGGNPRPPQAFAFGPTGLHRLRVGRYRVVYEVNNDARTVRVRHVGRQG
jgi:mRNA interferase RelE/StbE